MGGARGPPGGPGAPGPVRGVLLVAAGTVAAAQLAQAPLLARAVASRGGAAGDVGALQSLGGASQLVGGLWAGTLADRFGGGAVLVVSLIGGAASALLSTGAPLWALYVSKGLAIFQQGMLAARAAAVQRWDSAGEAEEGRAARLGMLGAAFGAGFVVGPAVGAAFGQEDPNRVALGATLACLAAAALVLAAVRSPGGRGAVGRAVSQATARERFQRVMQASCAWSLLGQKLVGDLCMAVFVGTFSLHLESRYGRGPRQAGYVLSYVGALSCVAQGGGVRALERRMGRDKGVRASVALMAVAFAALAVLPPSFAIYLACMAPLSLGSGFFSALNTARFAALVGPAEKGSALAVESAASAAARAAGSGLGVILQRYLGDAGVHAACAIPLFALVALTAPPGQERKRA